jgi:hypothetical protein
MSKEMEADCGRVHSISSCRGNAEKEQVKMLRERLDCLFATLTSY